MGLLLKVVDTAQYYKLYIWALESLVMQMDLTYFTCLTWKHSILIDSRFVCKLLQIGY